eukprot:scaffold164880_cov40-Cyclotella_meneghiniana.AAC.1
MSLTMNQQTAALQKKLQPINQCLNNLMTPGSTFKQRKILLPTAQRAKRHVAHDWDESQSNHTSKAKKRVHQMSQTTKTKSTVSSKDSPNL